MPVWVTFLLSVISGEPVVFQHIPYSEISEPLLEILETKKFAKLCAIYSADIVPIEGADIVLVVKL